MTDELENLVLVYLRRIDEKVDRMAADIQDLKHRMTSLETQFAGMRVDMAYLAQRIDRVEMRLERLERRMDLIPAQ